MTDLEHELATLQRRQGTLEDDLLELMERREAVELDGQHAGVELAKAEEALADASRPARPGARRPRHRPRPGATPSGRSWCRSSRSRCSACTSGCASNKGIGAALLRARRCGACRIELDRSAISRISGTAADEVVTCEECGAIMVRTPESGL